MTSRWSVDIVLYVFIGVGILSGAVLAQGSEFATESRGPSGLTWEIHVPFDSIALVVAGPSGEVFRGEFEESPVFGLFDQEGNLLPDGRYTYMLTASPRIDPSVREQLQALRESGDQQALDEIMETLGISGNGAWRLAGQFELTAGALAPDLEPQSADSLAASLFTLGGITDPLAFDITGDFSLTGDLGIGTDAPSQEIDIVDATPTIQMNDSDEASLGWFVAGGQAGFEIRRDFDNEVSRVFFLDPGAPNPSLWVDSGGDLGIRTSTPALDVHAVSGNTPGLRLEQDGSGSFTPQVWDISANESFFDIRDISDSTWPVRIRTGAPDDSIRVQSNGNVGFGTSNPVSAVHILRAIGEPNIRLETAAAAGVRFELVNAGGEWEFIHGPGGAFNFNRVGVVGNQFIFTTNGNMVIQGTLSQSSSRTTKKDISPVETREILAKVADLPLSSWSYKSDNARHVGPMAEDFWAAFDLGTDEKHLAPGDVAGVALAAVQGLDEKLTELSASLNAKDERILALEEELEELRALFANRYR